MSPRRTRRRRFRPSWVALVAAAAVSQGCILAVPPEIYAGREKAEWLRGYGYVSFGFAGHVGMFGDDMSGVEPSNGVTFNFPVAPGPVLVVGAAALIVAAASTSRDPARDRAPARPRPSATIPPSVPVTTPAVVAMMMNAGRRRSPCGPPRMR